MKSIGDRIKDRRQQIGMTQEDLAKKVGYTSKTTINKIENGANQLRQDKIKPIADALGVSVGFIMGWEEPVPTVTDFSEHEIWIIDAYRNAPQEAKDLIISVLKFHYNGGDQ